MSEHLEPERRMASVLKGWSASAIGPLTLGEAAGASPAFSI